jgi:hypothetical protein
MTHLLDTSAILAHHLAESGADRMQALFDDETNHLGVCVVSFLEFEVRLREMGLSESERQGEILRYKTLFDEVILVDEAVCSKAAELKFSATPRAAQHRCPDSGVRITSQCHTGASRPALPRRATDVVDSGNAAEKVSGGTIADAGAALLAHWSQSH